MYKKYAKRKFAPKRKYAKRTKRTTRAAGVRKIVKQVLSQNIENKRDYNSGAGDVPAAAGVISVLPLQISMLPVLGQSIGQGGRIGSEVTIKSSMLTLHFWAKPFSNLQLPYNTINKPQHLRVMIIKQKQLAVGATALTNVNNFFQLGSSSADFAGTLVDMSREINSDLFTIKYNRLIKVGQAAAATNLGSPGLFVPNNDYKLNCMVKVPIGKYMKKKLKYDDANIFNRVTNDNLFLVVTSVNFDNTGPDAPGLQRQVGYEYEIHTSYEDA